MSKLYTVWVGGVEVNDYLLNEDNASLLAKQYTDDGYTDVTVERVQNASEDELQLEYLLEKQTVCPLDKEERYELEQLLGEGV